MNQNEEFDLDKEIEEVPKEANFKDIINCPKCGQPMLKTARCCMHCGELNMLNQKNNPQNKYFVKGEAEKLKQKDKTISIMETKLDKNGVSKLEKKYTFWKNVRRVIYLIILIILLFNYKNIGNAINDVRKDSYLRQVDKIVEQFQEEYKDKNCHSTARSDRMYFTFQRSDDYFKTSISLFTFNYFSGYIEMVYNEDGTKDYILSLTDGRYGFENVKYTKDLSREIIVPLKSIDLPQNSIYCPDW